MGFRATEETGQMMILGRTGTMHGMASRRRSLRAMLRPFLRTGHWFVKKHATRLGRGANSSLGLNLHLTPSMPVKLKSIGETAALGVSITTLRRW